MTKAYSYIRFSSPEQRRGDSLRRQLEAAERYAEEHGLELDTTLRDLGKSAWRGKHRTTGALKKFLDLIEAGKVEPGSFLIVEHLDRLSREKVLTALRQFLAILDAGITIVTLQDDQKYTKEGLVVEQLMWSIMQMSQSNVEIEKKADRVGKAWAEKKRLAAAEGKPTSARCPLWLRLRDDRSRYEPIPERAMAVRRIFEAATAGLGAAAIARRLDEAGVPPFGHSDGWSPSNIKKILGNAAVIGIYQPMKRNEDGDRIPDGEPIPGYYPPVVDEGLFYMAAKAVSERRQGGGGRRGKTFTNLFQKIAICSECGRPMHYVDKGPPPRGGRYLACDGGRRRLCGHRKHHRYAELEAAVLNGVTELDFSAIVSDRDAVADARAEVAALSAKVGTLTEDVKGMYAAFGTSDSDFARDEIQRRESGLKTAKAGLKKAKADLRLVEAGADDMRRHADELGKLAAMLEGAEEDERFRLRAAMHQTLSDIVKWIEIPPNGVWTLTLRDGSFTTYVMMPGGLVRVPHAALEAADAMFDGVPDDETLEG